MRYFCCFLLPILFFGCQSSSNQQNTQTADTTAVASTAAVVSNDSLSLYFAELQTQGKLGTPQPIEVPNDPVFHAAKSYEGVLMKDILEKYTKIKTLDPAQTQIVFECEDGYNPSMSLALFLSKTAYLAVKDKAAPAGQDWINPTKDGREMKIAPFYVVYTDVPASATEFKWPYNLVKISLVETQKEFAAVYPKDDDTVVKGFGLFQQNCMTCHALNKVGGVMGPELNYPKNVTEYWQIDHLKPFIKNPSSYRHNCKMPAVTNLNDKALDEIIRYLQYMAKHKIKA
jgi:mono/diheme cytochrome c family protein